MQNNHGKVGKALYLKFRGVNFPKKDDDNKEYKHGDVLTIKELDAMGITSLVDVHIDDYTLGDYDCICENGTEVHYFGEKSHKE